MKLVPKKPPQQPSSNAQELSDHMLDRVAGGGAPSAQGGVAMDTDQTNRNGASGPTK